MDKFLGGLRTVLQATGRFELFTSKILMSWIVVVTGASILLRYGFNYSLHWSQEITLLSAQYLYFLGAAYIFKTGEYIIMDFIFQRLPERLKLPTAVVIHVLMLLFLVVAVWQAI
jgi:C4-dicarboxylate transporter DctQ subunit